MTMIDYDESCDACDDDFHDGAEEATTQVTSLLLDMNDDINNQLLRYERLIFCWRASSQLYDIFVKKMLARYKKNGKGAVSPQCGKVEEEEAVLSTNDVLLELSAGNLDPWEI